MYEKEINQTIKLLKRSSNNIIIFQMLYSHLNSLVCATKKINTDLISNDPFSQLLFYGALKQKCPLKGIEKSAYEFIKENKILKTFSSADLLKIIIIICYFINQDHKNINYFVMNELLNNYVFKNRFIDYLTIKFLFRGVGLNVFDIQVKSRIQSDIITSFLLQCKSRSVEFAFQSAITPLYAFYDQPPPNIRLKHTSNVFSFKIYESLYFFAKYAKTNQMVTGFFNDNFEYVEGLEGFINKSFGTTDGDGILCVSIRELLIDVPIDLYSLKIQYELINDKKKFKKDLLNWIETLE